jgi:hypothetical protein
MGNYKSKRQNSMIISDYDLSIINKTEFEIIDLDIIEFINEKIILTKQYLNSKTYINTYDLSKKEQQLIHIYDDNVREILVSNNKNYLAIVNDTYITIYDFQKLLKNKKDEIFKYKIDKSCVVQLFDDYFNYYVNKKLDMIDFKNKKSFEFSNIEKYKCDNKYIVFYDNNKISIVDIENKKEISSVSKDNIMFLYVRNNNICHITDKNECFINNIKILDTDIRENLFICVYELYVDTNINVIFYYNKKHIVFWIVDKKITRYIIDININKYCKNNGLLFYYYNDKNIIVLSLKYLIPIKILEHQIADIKTKLNEIYQMINYSNNSSINIISAEETIMNYKITPQMRFLLRNDINDFHVNVTANVSIYEEYKSFNLFQELLSGLITTDDIINDISKIDTIITRHDVFKNLMIHFYDFINVMIFRQEEVINEITMYKSTFVGYILLCLVLKYYNKYNSAELDIINEYKSVFPLLSVFIDKIKIENPNIL